MTMRFALVVALAFGVSACGSTPTSPSMTSPAAVAKATHQAALSDVVPTTGTATVVTASTEVSTTSPTATTNPTPGTTPVATGPVVLEPTTAPEGTPKWALSGKLILEGTILPLAGVEVVVLHGPNAGQATVSDATGAFTLSNLWQSGFTFWVKPGAETNGVTRAVTLTSDTHFEITLAPIVWTLSGRVVKEQGVAVAGATVTVQDGPNASRSTTSGPDGSYVIGNLKQGGFTVSATGSGFNQVFAGVTLVRDIRQDFTLNTQAPPTPPGTGTPGGNTPGGTNPGGGSFNGSVSLTTSGGKVTSISISGCRSYSATLRPPVAMSGSLSLLNSDGRDGLSMFFSWSVSGSSASGQIQYLGADSCAWNEHGMKSWSGSVAQ